MLSPPRPATWSQLPRIKLALLALTLVASASCAYDMDRRSMASVNGASTPRSSEPSLTYDRDPKSIWAHVKSTVVHLSARQPRFEEDTMSAFATLEDGSFRVQVSDVGEGLTEVRVKARKYGVTNAELGASVLATIDEQIER